MLLLGAAGASPKARAGATIVLGLVGLVVLGLLHPEGPTRHDELLQRARGRRMQLAGHGMGADEDYEPEEDCLHVKCKQQHGHVKWNANGERTDGKQRDNVGDKWSVYGALGKGFQGVDNHPAPKLPLCLGKACNQLHGEKWGPDGEPLDGHQPNIGDDWSAYGALGKGFKGVDNHRVPKLPLCLGKACNQLHGEKWGPDGEPLDGRKPDNVGDQWGAYGALGKGWAAVDNHRDPKLPPCLGKACDQLHGEKWGADGEPLPGHVRENIGDRFGTYGASGRRWKGVDKHRDFDSPFACMGKACTLKKLSRAGSTNVGDKYSVYGALGRPYKGTGKYIDRSDGAAPCLGGRASACHDASRPLGIKHWGDHGKPVGRSLRP